MPANNPIENLGDYLREQRKAARLSLRQLSDLAGVSNPYLSQIERGLKKPSAEILQALAKSLQVSAESLYVKAGFLDERTVSEHRPWDVETSIAVKTVKYNARVVRITDADRARLDGADEDALEELVEA